MRIRQCLAIDPRRSVLDGAAAYGGLAIS